MEGTLTSGKKYASGTAFVKDSTVFNYCSGANVNLSYVEIQLDFQPSTIIVTGTQATSNEIYSLYNSISKGSYAKTVKVGRVGTSSSSLTSQNIMVNDVVEPGGNVYRIPVSQSSSLNISWIAYE